MLSYIKNFTTLEIYTDGSSKNGYGSWAYIISRRRKCIIENSGRIRGANSNAMEFQAAIEALSAISTNSKVILFSDSKILIDAMSDGVGPKAFQTQIDILMRLNSKLKIKWHWIKAHNGNKFNERCDELCALARGCKTRLTMRES
jgi:ribonuclease HI